jgi:hypothetical protein
VMTTTTLLVSSTFIITSNNISLVYENLLYTCICGCLGPIAVPARSKAWVCGRSFAGIAGSNPAGGRGCLS